jgi:hypothetical protein
MHGYSVRTPYEQGILVPLPNILGILAPLPKILGILVPLPNTLAPQYQLVHCSIATMSQVIYLEGKALATEKKNTKITMNYMYCLCMNYRTNIQGRMPH